MRRDAHNHTPPVLSPLFVGRYRAADGATRFLPLSREEVDRARDAVQRILASFGWHMGRHVVISSLLDEAAQWLPFERAVMNANLVVCSVDASASDARRLEGALRRFDTPAAAGIGATSLDGLAALDMRPEQVFAGRVVCARPDAWQRLAPLSGFTLRRWVEVGPAVAMECHEGGGAHIDRLEWDVQEDGGEIVLSSRLARASRFEAYHTGVHARIESKPCACGNPDPRLIFE